MASSNTPRRAGRTSRYAGETINVKFQGSDQVYGAHKHLLCIYSDYFKGALQGPWKEAETRTVTLQATDPEAYSIFNDWLYTQNINIEPPMEVVAKDVQSDALVIRAWLLGDYLLAPKFQNATMDRFRQSEGPMWDEPMPISIQELYEKTTAESPLRRAFAARMVTYPRSVHISSIKKCGQDGSPYFQEFLLDLLQAFCFKKESGLLGLWWTSPMNPRKCTFHIHKVGEACEEEKPVSAVPATSPKRPVAGLDGQRAASFATARPVFRSRHLDFNSRPPTAESRISSG